MMIKGNLNVVEKPQINNLDIFVKNVYVDSKGFDFKVEGWLNYNKLQLTSSRDAIHEEGVEYEKFMQGLTKHLEQNYERKKTESKDQHVKAEKQLGKMFVTVISSIRDAFPDMAKSKLIFVPTLRGVATSWSFFQFDVKKMVKIKKEDEITRYLEFVKDVFKFRYQKPMLTRLFSIIERDYVKIEEEGSDAKKKPSEGILHQRYIGTGTTGRLRCDNTI